MSQPLEPLTPERRRQQTRDHLLAAAAQVFAERGFHGASLDQVAAAAGFSKGAVYSNFKSKDDLFLALLEATYRDEMVSLRATLDASDVPPDARLSDFLPLVLGRPDTQPTPDNWGVLYLEFSLYALRNPAARERLVELDDAAIGALADLLIEQRALWNLGQLGSAEQAARIVEALFRGIGFMRTLTPGVVDGPFLEAALSFVSRGLNPAADRPDL